MSEQEFETLAAEFIERHRLGQQPSVDEYADRFPEMADEIRELFPTMVALERLKEKKQQPPPPKRMGPLTIQQLGDYRIVREIGRGGMGIVYEAEQLSLGRRVAVKVLPKQSLLQPKHLERFQREATTAARLHHTNIVPVFGVGHDDGYHYIAMQFVDGVGLDEILVQLRAWILDGQVLGVENAFTPPERSSRASDSARSLLDDSFQGSPPQDHHADTVAISLETLTESPPVKPTANGSAPPAGNISSQLGRNYWRSVARLGQQAATAIAYAHEQGTLHRDLKPSNLLLDSDGHLWIADFGLAKAAEQQDAISRTGDVVGTLAFMAPEQLSGESDERSDVYSLGLTLYELLTLQPALTGASHSEMIQQINEGRIIPPRKHNPETPRDLETIVLKATSREPQARYASAAELAEDLQRFLDDRPIRARRTSWLEHGLRWSRRNPLAASLCGAIALLLPALLVVLSFAYASSNRALQAERDEQRKTRETLEITIDVLDGIAQQLAPDLVSTNPDDDETIDSSATTLTPGTVALMTQLIDGYEKLAGYDANNLELQERAAVARRRAGDIQVRLGRLAEASQSLQAAIKQFEKLKAENQQKSYLVELARVRNALGEVLWRQQDKAGRQEHLIALNMLSPAEDFENAEGELASREARFELARTLYLLGRRIDRPASLGGHHQEGPGRGGPPEGGHDRQPHFPPGAHPPGVHPPDRFPRGPEGRRPNSRGQGRPGRMPMDRRPPPRQGRPPGDRLGAESPESSEQPVTLSWSSPLSLLVGVVSQPPRAPRDRLGPKRGGPLPFGGAGGPWFPPPRRALKPPKENIDYLKRAIDVLESMESVDQGGKQVTRLRALCHRELADSPSSSHLDRAIRLFEQLHGDEPDVASYAFDLSRAYLTHLSEGPPTEIGAQETDRRLAEARALLESLTERNPSEAEYSRQLALVILQQNNKLINPSSRHHVRVWQQIRDDLEIALKLQRQVVELYPQSPNQQAALAVIEYRYAESCFGLYRFEEGIELLRPAIKRLEQFRTSLKHDRHRGLIDNRLEKLREALREMENERDRVGPDAE